MKKQLKDHDELEKIRQRITALYKGKDSMYWFPRIVAIVYIGFLSLFALDVFAMEAPIWEKIIGFFIHLLPNFLIVAVLAFAWKNENAGAILFALIAIVFTLFFETHKSTMSFLLISLPIFLIGGLFLWHSYTLKNRNI